jgi:hypothetical protein
MKTRILLGTALLVFISASQLRAQEFDLSNFAEDIENMLHKLEIGDKELDKCYEIYKSLSNSLLDLNEEIIGKNLKEVANLIEKKYAASNKQFQEVLDKEQFSGVKDLNDKQSKQLIEALTGSRGLIGTHGLVNEEGVIGKKGKRGQISIVVGTCIK